MHAQREKMLKKSSGERAEGVPGRVVLCGCRSSRGLLGGRRGCGLDIAALHFDAEQALPISPLQQQVALGRRTTTAAALGAS